MAILNKSLIESMRRETIVIDLLGLAGIILILNIVAPYLKGVMEGFANQPNPAQTAALQNVVVKDIKQQSMEVMQELDTLNKLLENPTIDSTTKDKIVKEKEELQKKLEKITGESSLPSAEIKPEGFTGVLSADLEKNSKASDFLQKATQSSL